MPGYLIASYTVTNQEEYQKYLAAVAPIMEAHKAEPVVADFNAEPLEGSPGQITIVMKFPSKEAIRAWYESPEYQAVKHYRTDNSEGVLIITEGFTPPA
jgi:uncharacterized protein (DUF1330 family)